MLNKTKRRYIPEGCYLLEKFKVKNVRRIGFKVNSSVATGGMYLLSNVSSCRLGGVVISVLATGPKGREFKPGRGDRFLRAITIRSTPSIGWEVKP
jgi:hypothetical protein